MDEEGNTEEGEEGDEVGEEDEEVADTKDDAEDDVKSDEEEQTGKPKFKAFNLPQIEALIKEVDTKPTRAAAVRMLAAFAAATHIGMEDAPQISSPQTFTTIVTWCIPNFPKLLIELYRLNADPKKSSTDYKLPKDFHKTKHWNGGLQRCLRNYLKCLNAFLEMVADSSMLTFAIDNSSTLIPMLVCNVRYQTSLLKSMLNIWATRDQASRLAAFVLIRDMCIQLPFPLIDQAFKGIYLAFVKNSRIVNRSTWAEIKLMTSCIIELYSLDFIAAYQHAFVYIRQLAIHLRNTIANLTQSTLEQVYNWQFFNSIQVWFKLITHYPKEQELQPLHYPIIQILFGVIRLHKSPRFLPFKLNCIRLLNELADRSESFINTMPLLLEIMATSPVRSHPKPTKSKPLNFKLILRVPQSIIGTIVYQDQLIKELNHSFMHCLSIYSDSAAFPEFAFPALVFFKENIKQMQNKDKKKFQAIVDLIQKQSGIISKKRSQSKVTLADVSKLKTFGTDNKDNSIKIQFSNLKIQDEQEAQEDMMDEDDIREANLDDDQNNLKKRSHHAEDEDDDDDEDEDGDDDDEDGDDADEDDEDDDMEVEKPAKSPKKAIKQENGKPVQVKKEGKPEKPGKQEKPGKSEKAKKEVQVKKEAKPKSKKAKRGNIKEEDIKEDVVEDFVFSDEED
eukprot:TRINITY_DN5247_c0_g4_i1.p1 TRINITY_DN5247_c0_g4~~TRINITY_DN5247_c0_g4_i1.p1  ORF type:complete len:785 (-),score=327.51 TRINITY_DN5247_c0_g4_i1:65-2089(-)